MNILEPEIGFGWSECEGAGGGGVGGILVLPFYEKPGVFGACFRIINI